MLIAEINAGLLPEFEGFLGSLLSSFSGKCGCPPAPDKEHKIMLLNFNIELLHAFVSMLYGKKEIKYL